MSANTTRQVLPINLGCETADYKDALQGKLKQAYSMAMVMDDEDGNFFRWSDEIKQDYISALQTTIKDCKDLYSAIAINEGGRTRQNQ